MDNQHRQIKGYRELTPEEIATMNEIKELAAKVGDLVARVQAQSGEGPNPGAEPGRWASLAKTQLQQGFMALTRSVARPEFF